MRALTVTPVRPAHQAPGWRLGLHRLRLSGELTAIRAADLRFSLAEARALLDAAGVPLSDAAVTTLHDRTEGWAAGLRLAALSLAGHLDPERFAAEFGGSERTVAEYLLAEVLDRQQGQARRLLLRTSILDRVNGELADLLTGGSGGERVLQRLEEAGALVVSLDAPWSPGSATTSSSPNCSGRAAGSAPNELPALHEAAVELFSRARGCRRGVRHAQAAHNWDLAARLLSDHWIGLGLAEARRAAFASPPRPARVIAADAGSLPFASKRTSSRRGSLEEAERYLALSARALDAVPAGRRGRAQVVLAAVRMQLARKRGDVAAVAEQARPLLATAAAAGPGQQELGGDLRALALINLGIAEMWTSRVDEADRHLADGIALAREIGRPYLELNGLAFHAQLASWRSFPLGAERGRQAIELVRPARLGGGRP